ncbi:MAG: hypothetical protein H0W20_05405 [Chthoniobacterales bacterium]|nr:hypothetical protein [Chthoniobacterales bacterium]
MKRKKLLVMGFMGSCPIAGVIWQHVHYIVGLQRLGHDVYYIEDSARFPYNPVTFEIGPGFEYTAALLAKLGEQFGFAGRWSFCARYLPGTPTAGLSHKRIVQLYRDADAILNVCGAQELHDDVRKNPCLLYIESDPAVEQIHVDQGRTSTIEFLSGHHALFTFGENVGRPDFPVPTHGFRWLPTRQPIVLDVWKTSRAPRADAVFTSVANWSTKGKDIAWRGQTYLWGKAQEFTRFISAPRKAGEQFELATDITPATLRARFERHGWRLRLPHDLSAKHRIYRDYIRGSKAEFTVAKDQYVRLNTGWFSDRSACYLAAGRPVITQDTGFRKFYGNEAGVFVFDTLSDVAEAVRMINSDYRRHSRAARELASEIFDSGKVLRALLDRAGI